MPLMSSPIDGSPMHEVDRYGVKLDICPTSGGIWLDKGELEKIIMRIREEALQDAVPPAAPGFERQTTESTQDYLLNGREHRPKRKKRESLFESLMDIFD